jgi:hypothetical protein
MGHNALVIYQALTIEFQNGLGPLETRGIRKFAISRGPGRQPANQPVETSTLDANQGGASWKITPRILASNGGFFASRSTYDDANLMTKKKLHKSNSKSKNEHQYHRQISPENNQDFKTISDEASG